LLTFLIIGYKDCIAHKFRLGYTSRIAHTCSQSSGWLHLLHCSQNLNLSYTLHVAHIPYNWLHSSTCSHSSTGYKLYILLTNSNLVARIILLILWTLVTSCHLLTLVIFGQSTTRSACLSIFVLSADKQYQFFGRHITTPIFFVSKNLKN